MDVVRARGDVVVRDLRLTLTANRRLAVGGRLGRLRLGALCGHALPFRTNGRTPVPSRPQRVFLSALAHPADVGIDVEVVDLPATPRAERGDLDPCGRRREKGDDRQGRQETAARLHQAGWGPAAAAGEHREVLAPE